jgi:hypothetical protein
MTISDMLLAVRKIHIPSSGGSPDDPGSCWYVFYVAYCIVIVHPLTVGNTR